MNDDEQELRDWLRAVEVPASRLEIDGLVRAGRRRAFRSRSIQAAGGVAVAAAVLLAAPSILTAGTPTLVEPAGGSSSATGPAAAVGGGPRSSAATPSNAARPGTGSTGPCQVSELPVPAKMKNVTPAGIDPTGRYIVGNDVVGQDFRPVLWTDGEPAALPVPGRSVQVTAVNAAGVAVGLVHDDQLEYVLRYEQGTYTRLRTPPGKWHLYPEPAINAAGDVVINAEPSGNSGGKDSIVLLWTAGSTTAVKLPLPDGANAFDITDDGTIIGAMYRNGTASAAYAWDQQGRGRKLTAPAGDTAAGYAAQGDWATGGLWPSGSVARWNLRTGEVTELAPGGPGEAVNASGWVVANGTLFRGGTATKLPVPGARDGGAAVAVSDTGLVVGQGRTEGYNSQHPRPSVWRC